MYNYLFKIIVIGDTYVGKSCLTLRFINDEYRHSHESTIGVEFGTKTITIDDKKIKLQIWDTAGQEIFRSITRSYYRSSAGAILVFDLTNKISFQNIKRWLNDVKTYANENTCIILVGNKCDLLNRDVSNYEIDEIIDEYNLDYVECSAKDNINIDKIFMQLGNTIYEKITKNNRLLGINNGIIIGQYNNQNIQPLKNSCC
jgi:small GTP-binding protein